jgi:hypothetical protein
MRLVLKLLCACGLAVLLQCAITPPVDELDQLQFDARVFVANVLGIPNDAPDLLDAAERLQARQIKRYLYRWPVAEPATAAENSCEPAEFGEHP